MGNVKAFKPASWQKDRQFAIIILSHGRAERCFTVNSVRAAGYTGPIVLLLDNEDETIDKYRELYKNQCHIEVFDKADIARRFPNADNFTQRRSPVYARNAAFEVAKKLGYRYFMQMDDDYMTFCHKMNEAFELAYCKMICLDDVLAAMLEFYKNTPSCHSIAMAQAGGDYAGGPKNVYIKNGWVLRRKIMNSWLCDTQRQFSFIGRMNEDVNTYVSLGVKGYLFFTVAQVCLVQSPTQSLAGGMSEVYHENGTYMKSFYTVMLQPSSVKIGEIGAKETRRLHHCIDWSITVPRLIPESYRKE